MTDWGECQASMVRRDEAMPRVRHVNQRKDPWRRNDRACTNRT